MVKYKEKTKGNLKVLKYLDYLITDEYFLNKVKNIRCEWKKYSYKHKNNADFSVTKKYWSEINSICKRFDLPIYKYFAILTNFIVNEGWQDDKNLDICNITSYDRISGIRKSASISDVKKIESEYPVLISINSYASREDVLDFIKKNFTKKIAPILKKAQNKNIVINKLRNKNEKLKERDKFILEHNDISAKELASLVNKEKFSKRIISYDNIAKIRSKQKKKLKISKPI